MDAEQALIAYLQSQSTITTLLGSSPMRVFPLKLNAPNTLPAVTTQALGIEGVHSLMGYSNMQMFTWQLTVWGTTYNNVKTVRNALHLLLFGLKSTLSTIRISIPNISEPINTWEPVTQTFQRVLDCTVHAEYSAAP